MHHSRLLVAGSAAAALLFTGLAPASASDYDSRNGRTEAKVVSIDRDADANGRGTKVDVSFEYKCKGDARDINTKVTLKQDDARFSAEFEGRLRCNGRTQEKTVTLRNHGGRLDNDDAKVTVRFKKDNGRTLDEKSKYVDVKGVHRNR